MRANSPCKSVFTAPGKSLTMGQRCAKKDYAEPCHLGTSHHDKTRGCPEQEKKAWERKVGLGRLKTQK